MTSFRTPFLLGHFKAESPCNKEPGRSFLEGSFSDPPCRRQSQGVDPGAHRFLKLPLDRCGM